MTAQLDTLDDVRAFIKSVSASLDPQSRYIAELNEIVAASKDVADLVRRLSLDSRGKRHAGADIFARMTLEQKLRCNLVTNETVLFRFTEGEWLALQKRLLPRFERENANGMRILCAPCSHGEEAYSLAAACLQTGVPFRIDALDIQPECIAEAATGRLTMGFPVEHLDSPAIVGRAVLQRIDFRVGDLLVPPGGTGIPDKKWDLIVCRNFLGYFVDEVAIGCAVMLGSRVEAGGALFVDSFCLGKFPGLEPALVKIGLTRDGSHPVFLRS